MSPVEELRAAATRLRETSSRACIAPWAPRPVPGDRGTDVAAYDGAVTVAYNASKADAAWIALASPLLAEPLAAWLEKTAKRLDEETYEQPVDCPEGVPGCTRHDVGVVCDLCAHWVIGGDEACECFGDAIDVARTINGASPT